MAKQPNLTKRYNLRYMMRALFYLHSLSLSPVLATFVVNTVTTMTSIRNNRCNNFYLKNFLSTSCGTSNFTRLNTMSSSTVTKNIKFRPGRLEDEPLIKKIMIRQLMNPLSIRYQNFIVAVPFDGGSNVKDEKGICGFAQIRPLGEKGFDPNIIDSAPGSGSDVLETLKGDTYEDIWEEFEDNTLDFPNGFGSLPWSKEYQLYARKSKEMRENNLNRLKNVDEYVAKQRQQKKGNNYNSNFLWELASVYVDPKWRNQGIGSELIQKVISKHIMLGRKVDDIYLLTIDDKIGWYQKLGFGITVDPPKYMKLEIMAGSLIVKLISDGSKNLVCMKALSKRVSGNNNIEIGSSS